MIHIAGIIAAVAVIVLCTLLPFLPGPYDPLAPSISMMARVFGMAGLLLVPIGALWFASWYSQSLLAKQRAIAMIAWMAVLIVWAVVSFAAFALTGLSLALITAVAGGAVLYSWSRRLSSVRPALYLFFVPLAVFPIQRVALAPAVEFSRDRAIANSAQFIAAIEQFRATRGHYPESLLSVQRDYSPGIIGIDRYHYERQGQAFNLVFEQPAAPLGTQEIVVYNPRDEQTATGHVMDILEFTPEHLERTRGYYAVHAARHPHWKYFWFD